MGALGTPKVGKGQPRSGEDSTVGVEGTGIGQDPAG